MQREVINFYSSLRQIFLVCPCCDQIHRLSDCKLFQQKTKPQLDWKDKIDNEIRRLGNLKEKLEEKIDAAKEAAKETGRISADKHVKKIDKIFSPLRLNPKDAKVIFHPLDFLVFNGMNNKPPDNRIKQIILLDKNKKSGENASIQNSIDKAVNTRKYEWLTLRVQEDGQISEE